MTVDVIDIEVVETTPPVSWVAILAGALAAIAATLILFSLGSGLEFAAASPWGDVARTAGRLGVAAGIWLIVVQWIASACGGYLTGRLRTRWRRTHTHEVFFRDTAHGFLAWALATVVIAAVATASGLATTGGAAATAAAGAAQNFAYDADTLYRTPTADEAALAPVRAEAERLLAAAAARGGLDPADHDFLAASISSRTGVSPTEAQRRLDVVTQREAQAATDARVAADKARKAASAFAIFTALSMVIGAFIASAAAALGGQLRDEHP
jgi:hypothetical protein